MAEIVERLTVLFTTEEYARLTDYCHSHGFKKSTLVARIVREYLDRSGDQSQMTLPLSRSQQPRKLTSSRTS